MDTVPALHVRAPRTSPRSVVLVLHGGQARSNRPTRASNAASLRMIAFAERARDAGARVSYLEVRGDGHPMLRRAALWHAFAAQFVVGALTDPALSDIGDAAVTNLVQRALAGEYSLVV